MTRDEISKQLTFYKWSSEQSTIFKESPIKYDIDEFFNEIRSDNPYKDNNCFVVNKSINGKRAEDFLCPCIVFIDIDFHFDDEQEKINEIKQFCIDTNSTSLQDFVDKLSNDIYCISAGLSRSGKGIRMFYCVNTDFYRDSILYDLDYSIELNKAIHKSNFNYVLDYLKNTYNLNLDSKYMSDRSPSKITQVTYRFKLEGSFYNELWEPLYNPCVIELKEYSNVNDSENISNDFLDGLLENNTDLFRKTFAHYNEFNSLFYVLRNQPDDIIAWFYKIINRFYSIDGGFRKQGHLDSLDSFTKHVKSITTGQDLPLRAFLFKRGIYYNETIVDEDVNFSPESIKKDVLPLIPQETYSRLPKILKDLTNDYNDEKKDFILLSTLATTSIYFNNVKSTYFEGNIMYPNIYFFGIGNSSSGKSSIIKVKNLIKRLMMEQRLDYKLKKGEYDKLPEKDKKIEERPKEIKYVLGGDGGRASLIKYLQNNNEQVLFWDTEADSLSMNSKSEWGDITPLLRAGVMNESIDKNRLIEDSIFINCPRISINITGTYEQPEKVYGKNGITNGTFSRFLWYWYYKDIQNLEDPHKNTDNSLFLEYGDKLYDLWLSIKDKEINFDFTTEQKDLFFTLINKIFYSVLRSNSDISEIVNSLLLKYFNFSKKISMILTMLRAVDKNSNTLNFLNDDNIDLFKVFDTITINPTNDDIYSSLDIIQICLKHALCYLRSKSHEDKNEEPVNNWIDDYYIILPDKIKVIDAKKIGVEKFSKSERTVRRALQGLRDSNKIIYENDKKEYYIKVKNNQ
jgi:hypothetical protein